jgi:flagellar biosynthesis protein FlhF
MNHTEVRTYKAATMQEALDLVRKDLGADAVILHTREVPVGRLRFFRKPGRQVEVTAGLGLNVRPAHARAQPGRTAAVTSGYGPAPALPHALAALPPLPGPHPAREAFPAAPLTAPAVAPAEPGSSYPAQPRESASPPGAETAAGAALASFSRQQADIARQLSSIQQLVARLSRESICRDDEIPSELFQVYTELIDSEVDADLARDLVRGLKGACTAEELVQGAAVRQKLDSMIEAELRCAAPISVTPGQRKVVALVGPTGVGKTTTIAKLAANFRLRAGVKMGLVTVDTYRIAAVEQLRTYAEIIDLPMKVVTTPREMRRALDELAGMDLVLIDTAGRSPRDELKIQELRSLLTEARVDEVHLVLSLVASLKGLKATAEHFAAAGTTAMILTKLDEAMGMGALLSASRCIPLPISYLTTGQDVPDDIEAALPGRIARLALGRERISTRRRISA